MCAIVFTKCCPFSPGIDENPVKDDEQRRYNQLPGWCHLECGCGQPIQRKSRACHRRLDPRTCHTLSFHRRAKQPSNAGDAQKGDAAVEFSLEKHEVSKANLHKKIWRWCDIARHLCCLGSSVECAALSASVPECSISALLGFVYGLALANPHLARWTSTIIPSECASWDYTDNAHHG